MPSRRGFLGLLAGAALDPERLLWVPGNKLISIPRPPLPGDALAKLAEGDVFTISGILRPSGDHIVFRVVGDMAQDWRGDWVIPLDLVRESGELPGLESQWQTKRIDGRVVTVLQPPKVAA